MNTNKYIIKKSISANNPAPTKIFSIKYNFQMRNIFRTRNMKINRIKSHNYIHRKKTKFIRFTKEWINYASKNLFI